jgi:hypothetical protein
MQERITSVRVGWRLPIATLVKVLTKENGDYPRARDIRLALFEIMGLPHSDSLRAEFETTLDAMVGHELERDGERFRPM